MASGYYVSEGEEVSRACDDRCEGREGGRERDGGKAREEWERWEGKVREKVRKRIRDEGKQERERLGRD